MSDLKMLEWALELDLTQARKPIIENIHGQEFYRNEGRGIEPYFTNLLMERIHKRKACNVVFVGEAGSGKTYMANQVARNIYPKFCIDQVVYGYAQYYDVLMDRRFGIGAPINLDEPQDAIDHREWYKEVQQAIIKTITSQRFMVKPLFIPIINTNLIDKTIRNYLIQYQVECIEPGFARVFSLSPSQKEDKTYFTFICNLRYGMMDNDLCDKRSCLFCNKLDYCGIFRAQYERKKAVTVYQRIEKSKEDAIKKESLEISLDRMLISAYELRTHFSFEKKIDVKKLRVILREPPTNIHIGHNKAYDLKCLLEYRYPDEFQDNT